MKIECYAALGEKQLLEKFEYESKVLANSDVEVAIAHCGICYSDVHRIDNDHGISSYPFVPGHEIVGHITKMGSKVTTHKKGDRVGIGWQSSACMKCEWCLKGEENLCSDLMNCATWIPYGGFAKYIIVDSRFAFHIPKNLDSANAVPLLCAGITVYTPLRNEISSCMKVGIIGLGGLGHLAVQFSRALGYYVIVFSSTPSKEKEAKYFGAHHFVESRDTNHLKDMTRILDIIISTVHLDLDWNIYLNMLKPNGKLYILGVPSSNIKIEPGLLISRQISICGSVIGDRSTMLEMLEFSALHDIKAKTELMSMSEVNQAIEKLKTNKARYRIVLKN